MPIIVATAGQTPDTKHLKIVVGGASTVAHLGECLPVCIKPWAVSLALVKVRMVTDTCNASTWVGGRIRGIRNSDHSQLYMEFKTSQNYQKLP